MDLFRQNRESLLSRQAPLADRMRPRTLDEFIGQEHIIGPGRLLRRAIQIDQLSSLIFYGPPGTGKTTLARIIANTTKSQFLSINAVLAGVKDIREAIDEAAKTLELYAKRTILFIDEVHRFNKSQQDALLPHVENGLIVMIGATTENPYFEVNKALVSRSRVFQLKSLTQEDLVRVARQALEDESRGYGNLRVDIDDEAILHLVKVSNGDARGVLNALQLAVETTSPGADGVIRINRSIAEESIQQRAVLYDKDGDAHYDTISAFIKSVRGSDPDAALYWMSKMVYAGEDPRFIFRRMLILACEDVGMADPQALGVVMDAARAFDYVGLPEGRYHLAHACLYLATAAKSNSSMAFFDALSTVEKEQQDDVPRHLRDASRDSEGLGDGEGYLYPHAYRDHWVAQQYLPDTLMGKVFYQPSDQGHEKQIQGRVLRLREAQVEAMVDDEDNDALSTTSAGTPGSGQWQRRTAGSSGAMLDRIRERLFELAPIGRDSLVLDLHARTGLLTFHAARTVTSGGVWALAHDEKSHETLTSMSRSMAELDRPTVLRVTWDSFLDDLRTAAGAGVAFDAVVGRNVIGKALDRSDLVARVTPLLRPRGVIALAEVVASMGQRISDLCNLSGLGDKVRKQFVKVEEELFSDPAIPLVNWSDASLRAALGALTGIEVKVSTETFLPAKRLTPADVEHWFREAGSDEQPSLGGRLRRKVDEEGVEKIRAVLHAQLDNRTVQWKTVVAFVRVTNSPP